MLGPMWMVIGLNPTNQNDLLLKIVIVTCCYCKHKGKVVPVLNEAHSTDI
jgi:hypothetical protein